MRAAREAVNGLPVRRRPLLLGVTLLTSLEEKDLKNEMGIGRPLKKEVLHLAGLAQKSGLDGVVASGEEASLLKRRFGKNFTIVTSGIRPAGSEPGDQKRWVTPEEAFRLGSDYVVIGRPITRADDPAEAFRKIVREISG
jgi:orotidine-5'-phosphate decarboxylase